MCAVLAPKYVERILTGRWRAEWNEGDATEHVDLDPYDVISFPVGASYATSATGAGALALGEGWSRPDRKYTWSEGPRASLAIRLIRVVLNVGP